MDTFSALFQEVSVFFSKMTSSQKLTLGMFVVTITVVIISLTSSAMVEDTDVLFRNLSRDEETMVLSKLESYGVHKELKNGMIYVNKDERDNIIMRLSIDNSLPEERTWGFFDLVKKGNEWTDTSESKRQKKLYALQNEVAKMIESLDKISSAKVIISDKPMSRLTFNEEWEKRTATVTVRVKNGRTLSREEAEGIANIVAGATEELIPENVSVVDTKGKPYNFSDSEDGSEGRLEKWERTRKLEATYEDKIKNVLFAYKRKSLEDIKVSVSLTLNFDKVVEKSNRLVPDEAVVYEKETTDTTSVERSGDIVGAGPNAGANNNGGNNRETSNTSSQKNLKTQTSTVVTETVKQPGDIETISVAVTLPHKIDKDQEGNVSESPLDAKTIQDAKELVINAVGKDLLKVDNVVIKSVPFTTAYVEEEVDTKKWYEYISENIPPWFEPTKAILGAILFLVVIRLFSMTKKVQKDAEMGEDDEIELMVKKVQSNNEDDLKIQQLEENLNKAINEDVKKAATIIKRWAVSG